MNMKRKTLFHFIFVTLTILTATFGPDLRAQDCVPNDISLHSQVEVDEFQASHGPCDRLHDLHIQGTDIVNLNGLSALMTVHGELLIQDNDALTSLGGLSAITNIAGNLFIQNNASIANVDGLSGLESVGDRLIISNNPALSDLDGLSALQWVHDLWVFGNSTLANCRGVVKLVDRIDDYEPGPGGSFIPDVEWDADFSQNLPRCNSTTEILVDAALTEVPNCSPWRIDLRTQADIDNFQASHGPCDRVGMLEITGEDIVNLDGLSVLTKVGALIIEYNPQLTLVNGLQAFTSVDAFLVIRGNERLRTLDGLSGITSVGDNLFIITNLSLINVDGLSGLTSVGGTLSIRINAVLDNLDGLSKVTSVGGLSISLNGRLRNLDGLSGITHVGGDLQIHGSESFTNLDGLSNIVSVGGDLYIWVNPALVQCSALSGLLDQWDDAEPGPGPGPGVGGVPDIGGKVTVENNLSGCNSIQEIMAAVNPSKINPGLNDAWYYPETNGQGFFITVFPDLGYVSLAWFTYDTELPPMDATANLGDPGHRWITALGPIEGNQVLMDIEMTSGGIFDSTSDITRTDPPGSDGTIILTFYSCNSGTVEYDIPSINRQGTVPIQRVADDNIALCEALNSNLDQPLFPAQ